MHRRLGLGARTYHVALKMFDPIGLYCYYNRRHDRTTNRLERREVAYRNLLHSQGHPEFPVNPKISENLKV
jgi:hypothetical protein